MKKIGLLGLIGLVLFITGCGCDKKENKEENKKPETIVNTNENVVKDQNIDGLMLTNTSLTTTDGSTNLVTQVTNNTGADYYLVEFIITIKDAEGNVMVTIPGHVGDVIANGETRTIDNLIDIDLSKAASVEYSITK